MATTAAELEALLMQRSLTDPELVAAVDAAADFRILPDATVIKIGGQSIIDRGRAAVPPYSLWMRPATESVIPPYRTDAGCFLVAEQFGCKAMIYVKDENGLYTANPKTSKDATFIPKISVAEMKAKGLQDSILEFLRDDVRSTLKTEQSSLRANRHF
jgi:hypothetical protein